MFPKLYLVKNIFLSNLKRTNFPYKLTLALTHRCNAHCKTCLIWQVKKDYELKYDEIINFFKKNDSFSWVDLTGGEIFMREDIKEIIKVIFEICKKLCILHFPTNGLLVNKIVSSIEEIAKSKLNKFLVITISVDGPEKINDEIKGLSGAFRSSIETYRQLKEITRKNKYIKVYIGITLSQFNFNKINELFIYLKDTFEDFDSRYIHINTFHRSYHLYNNMSLPLFDKEMAFEAINNILRLKNKRLHIDTFLERNYLIQYLKYLKLNISPIKCQALSASIFIDSYGDIYPCTMYNSKMANIKDIDYDIRKIWRKKSVIDLISDCPHCWTPCEAYLSILGSLYKVVL